MIGAAIIACEFAFRTHVEMALVRADPEPPRPHPSRFQLVGSASPIMIPSGPRRKQSR
jgi:hypothetical protein